ncbi:hypothetical protein ACFYUY_23860 [Kitasatospora sp. NPDC004745]|uniref:hypothetical protein n=1 Tax=Kitasatospora sp. NPDC004745 TaxID=3364019 RepID=UPI0036CF5485
MTVTARTEQALQDAMERLFSGQPQHTDGKLTKTNLCREAGVSRATMNRATAVLAEWDARTAASPAALVGRQRDHELAELRRKLRESGEERRRLQGQVDAAATVIMTLLTENAALREQAARRPAVIVPITSSATDRP